jgi:hypothetical protein
MLFTFLSTLPSPHPVLGVCVLLLFHCQFSYDDAAERYGRELPLLSAVMVSWRASGQSPAITCKTPSFAILVQPGRGHISASGSRWRLYELDVLARQHAHALHLRVDLQRTCRRARDTRYGHDGFNCRDWRADSRTILAIHSLPRALGFYSFLMVVRTRSHMFLTRRLTRACP